MYNVTRIKYILRKFCAWCYVTLRDTRTVGTYMQQIYLKLYSLLQSDATAGDTALYQV